MKINLNESEKNRILGLYKKSNTEYFENNLLSEVNDMFRLMRLENKNNNFVLSEAIVPTGGLKEIFEHIPVLKPLIKDLEGEYIEGLSKNLNELSEQLRKRGITDLDSLIKAASDFADANKGIFKETTDDAKILIERYFTHTGVLGEIRKSLQNKIIGKIQQETNAMLEKFKTSLEGLDGNINNSPYEEFYTTSKNLSDGMAGDIGNLKNNIDEIDRINKEVDDAITEITSYRTDLGPTPKKGTPEYAQYTKYSRYIEELNKLKQILNKQKSGLTSVKESIDLSRKLTSDTIFWKGKTYNVADMNEVQKSLLRIGADHLGLLTNSIIRFIVNSRRFVSLRTQLVENITKLKDLSIKMKDIEAGTLTKEFSDYTTDTANLIEQLNGKFFRFGDAAEKNYKNVIREIIGGGTSESGYAEIQTIWKEIVGILKQEKELGNLTESEVKKILDDILTKYSATIKNEKVPTDDLNAFEGLLSLRYDLESVGKATGYQLNTQFDNSAKLIINTDTKFIKNLLKNWSEAAAGVNTASFWKGVGGVFLREFTLGLPLNVRYYLKPIAKYGINLKSSLSVLCRLSAAKALSTIVFGAVGAWTKYLIIKTFWSEQKTEEEMKSEAWSSWNSEMEKYKTFNISQIFAEVMPEIDVSSEMKTDKITGREYIEKQNADFGIIDFNLYSTIMELYSRSEAMPSGTEIAEYIKKESERANENTKKEDREEINNYQNLYYTFTPEEQRRASGANVKYDSFERGATESYKVDSSVKTKVLERFFMKMVHVGQTVLDISNIAAIKKSYNDIEQYKGYPCVCRTPLKYDVLPIQIGGKTKSAQVPLCDDYLRLINYNRDNISDFQKKGMDDAPGFTTVKKLEKVKTSQWSSTINIGKYLN
jgi:hypothetical protein